MDDLTTLLERARSDHDAGLTDLEQRISERIAMQSGAKRSAIGSSPVFAVQAISLDPDRTGTEFDATVNWIARRMKEAGARVFAIALRRQPARLVLTAEWPRSSPATAPTRS